MMAPTRPHDPAARELFDEISRWPIFDPHSHINPRQPAARDLDEILGYHYYTELAHSGGMPAALVAPELAPRERVRNLARHLDPIDNTVQYSWLVEIAQTFHGFDGDRLTPDAIEQLADRADAAGQDGAGWDREVWDRSNLEAVFLTSDFDDPLDGWDTSEVRPLPPDRRPRPEAPRPRVVDRLKTATGVDVVDYPSVRQAIGVLFDRFVGRGRGRARSASRPTSSRRAGRRSGP